MRIGSSRFFPDFLRFAFNVGSGTFLAFLSGMLVYLFAPAAAGSGIPEVKTILQPSKKTAFAIPANI